MSSFYLVCHGRVELRGRDIFKGTGAHIFSKRFAMNEWMNPSSLHMFGNDAFVTQSLQYLCLHSPRYLYAMAVTTQTLLDHLLFLLASCKIVNTSPLMDHSKSTDLRLLPFIIRFSDGQKKSHFFNSSFRLQNKCWSQTPSISLLMLSVLRLLTKQTLTGCSKSLGSSLQTQTG